MFTIVLAIALVWAQSAAVLEDFHEETVGNAPMSFSTPTGWWSISTDGTDAKPVLFEDGTRYGSVARAGRFGQSAANLVRLCLVRPVHQPCHAIP